MARLARRAASPEAARALIEPLADAMHRAAVTEHSGST
jgi:hypothetical protein